MNSISIQCRANFFWIHVINSQHLVDFTYLELHMKTADNVNIWQLNVAVKFGRFESACDNFCHYILNGYPKSLWMQSERRSPCLFPCVCVHHKLPIELLAPIDNWINYCLCSSNSAIPLQLFIHIGLAEMIIMKYRLRSILQLSYVSFSSSFQF